MISSLQESYFDISFNLSTPTEVQLNGVLSSGRDTGYWSDGRGYSDIFLYDSTGSELFHHWQEDGEGGQYLESTFLYNNTLGPGDYRLAIKAAPTWTDGHSTYSLQASLTAVPLPAAGSLFLFGLSGFLLICNKRRAV